MDIYDAAVLTEDARAASIAAIRKQIEQRQQEMADLAGGTALTHLRRAYPAGTLAYFVAPLFYDEDATVTVTRVLDVDGRELYHDEADDAPAGVTSAQDWLTGAMDDGCVPDGIRSLGNGTYEIDLTE